MDDFSEGAKGLLTEMQRNKNKNMFYLDVLHISQSEDERLQGNLFSENYRLLLKNFNRSEICLVLLGSSRLD